MLCEHLFLPTGMVFTDGKGPQQTHHRAADVKAQLTLAQAGSREEKQRDVQRQEEGSTELKWECVFYNDQRRKKMRRRMGKMISLTRATRELAIFPFSGPMSNTSCAPG